MNTNNIPDGWWLNVTIMATYQDSWIVAVIRKGKASWITEHIILDFDTSEEAYEKGMEWIENYKKSRL